MKKSFYILMMFVVLAVSAVNVSAYESPVARIVGGTTVATGAIPFQVGLREYNGSSYTNVFCGGTLISNQWVLTAAHCVDLYADVTEAANKIKVMTDTNVTTFDASKLHTLSQAIMHESYNSSSYNNDIALLKLSSPVSTTVVDYLSTNTKLCYSDGDTSIVSGWGLTSFGGSQPVDLLHVDLPIIDKTTCELFWGLGRITDGMLCAGGIGGEDSCQGDSGGPLFVLDSGDRAALIGIVSFGPAGSCGDAGEYGVYTKVGNYTSWIESKTGLTLTQCYDGYDPIDYDANSSGTNPSTDTSTDSGGGGGGGCSASGEGSPFSLILMALFSAFYLYRRKRV